MEVLHIFYEEPDNDRWIKYDRYPRRIFRKFFGKKESIGGVKKWFVNLIKGLDLIGHPYKINDFKSLKNDPNIIALVIGKPQIIERIPNGVKIVYGPAVASHPSDNDFWKSKDIVHMLFSCKWLNDMYQRDLILPINSTVWPSGIETEIWKPNKQAKRKNRILVYDKIRWDYNFYRQTLIDPILLSLREKGIEVCHFRYGFYLEDDFKTNLKEVDAMIFLCEHETQGFAYLQALASNVPILAWDRGGDWKDPAYYPDKVTFAPVTSVPYWEDRCGLKFKSIEEFEVKITEFLLKLSDNEFSPRNYILDNLSLELCATNYVNIYKKIKEQLLIE